MTSASEFVDFHITVCGIEELAGHGAVGVTHVLSILDPGFPDPEAFGAFGEHERLDLRFHDIIDELPDLRLVQREDVEALLRFGRDLMRQPRAHLLVHCHMGISRSTAAMALILTQARPDRPASEALAEVRRIRPRIWPNLRVIELGDELLGRGGELVAAAVGRYRHVIERRPEVGQAMIQMGRGREVRAAEPDG
ncbi:MAG TPA: protein-tyrosine-phosphatase [Stellaceae bacterium]